MIPLVPLAAVGALVFTFVNTLRYLTAGDWSAVTTQVVAWAAGVVGMFLFRATDFAAGIRIGDLPLDRLNLGSTAFMGLLATSLLSTVNELKKAIDRSDSAQVPPLLPRPPRPERMTQAAHDVLRRLSC